MTDFSPHTPAGFTINLDTMEFIKQPRGNTLTVAQVLEQSKTASDKVLPTPVEIRARELQGKVEDDTISDAEAIELFKLSRKTS